MFPSQGTPERGAEHPIGIYRKEGVKEDLGALDPAMADAFVQGGFALVKEFATWQEVAEALKSKTARRLAKEQEEAPANEPVTEEAN